MQESFEHVKTVWLEQINHYANSKASKLLVANKCDLEDKRVVDFITAKVSVATV